MIGIPINERIAERQADRASHTSIIDRTSGERNVLFFVNVDVNRHYHSVDLVVYAGHL